MIKVLKRPLILNKSEQFYLDKEFSNVRWINHKLIDFEEQHQQVLDNVMPELTRVGSLVARLEARRKRAERSTKKELGYHPVLLKSLNKKILHLKKVRNASEEWKKALKWDQEKITQEEFNSLLEKYNGDFSDRVLRRQAGESDEALEQRALKVGAVLMERNGSMKYCTLPTRREAFHKELYRQRSCYYNSFVASIDAVKQSKSAVLKERKAGKSARIRRPRHLDSYRIYFQIGKKRPVFDPKSQLYIEKGKLWWDIKVPIGIDSKSVTAKFKGGNWHELPDDAQILEVQLIRKSVANRYKYHICITIDGSFKDSEFAKTGEVGLDWGHRQMSDGLRAFTYFGSDKISNNINLKVRELLDLKVKIISNLDKTFDAKKVGLTTTSKNGRVVPVTSRYQYRRFLMRLGVRSAEECAWLQYETQQEKRIDKINRRIDNLRTEVYTKHIRNMRMHYSVFGVENITGNQFKEKYKDDMDLRRKRQNRDVVARYKFMSLLEKYGAKLVKVDPAFTTKTCPFCGNINESTQDVTMSCTSCGKIGDRDIWAAMNILKRTQETVYQAAE